MSSINIVDESEKRERFHTCTEDVTGSKCPKSASKKRPRIKTHAKTMIQARRNYMKRKEPESENDLTEVFENPEEAEEGEEDRSPKSKKKKRDNNGEKHNKTQSPFPKNPTSDDEEGDKWTIDAFVTYTDLVSSTDNKEIKEIIKCMDMEEMYQKKYQKTRKNIVDYLTTFKGKEKEQIISGAIEYITDECLPANWMTQKSESQLLNIIMALRNRMPNWCTGCKDWYSVKKGDKPKLKCMMCDVGRHECNNNNESPIGIGISWICPECIDINTREGLLEKAKAQTKEMIVYGDSKRNQEKHMENEKKSKKDIVDNRKDSSKLKEMNDDFALITPKNCLNDTHI